MDAKDRWKHVDSGIIYLTYISTTYAYYMCLECQDNLSIVLGLDKSPTVLILFCNKAYLLRKALVAVWPEENRQMSIKVAQKWFH